jgi:hypothetical protein
MSTIDLSILFAIRIGEKTNPLFDWKQVIVDNGSEDSTLAIPRRSRGAHRSFLRRRLEVYCRVGGDSATPDRL